MGFQVVCTWVRQLETPNVWGGFRLHRAPRFVFARNSKDLDRVGYSYPICSAFLILLAIHVCLCVYLSICLSI